jgi:photosystem II stability/assembly factor-like uncharacterized protein
MSMKRITLITLALILFTSSIQSQWVQISMIGSNELRSVKFFNEHTGIVVGQGGIWRSTNSGVNWIQVVTGGNYNALHFPNDTYGYAVGDSGKVYKTSNNGINWSALNSGTVQNLLSVNFINQTTGQVGGSNGIMLRTQNEGASFNPQTAIGDDYYDVKMTNASTIYAIGSTNYETVITSLSGGTQWSGIYIFSGNGFRGLEIVNTNPTHSLMCVGLNGRIRYTTNAGFNWVTQASNTSQHLNDVMFINSSTGGPEETHTALADYYIQYYDVTYPAYVCGIDSLDGTVFDDIAFTDATYRQWSFVLVGKMGNTPAYQDELLLYTEGAMAHEFGHQIGLPLTEHGIHTGKDSIRCIMRNPIVSARVRPDMRFCDRHICFIYANTTILDRLPSSSGNNMQNIEVTIQNLKNTFVTAENFFITITIKNKGNSPETLTNLDELTIAENLIVVNEQMEKLPHSGLHGLRSADKEYILQPKDSIVIDFDVIFHFGKPTDEYHKSLYKEIPKGNYTIVLDGDKSTFKKNITSNQFMFSVLDPVGDISLQKKELESIGKISSITERMKQYRNFVYAYSESPYMEQAFSLSLGVKRVRDEEVSKVIIEDCKWFIEKRVNSPYIPKVIGVCGSLIKKYQSGFMYKAFLNEIVSKYPNTKASYVAHQYIKKYKGE